MHCPKCGAEAPLTQKFCRGCGFSLEKIPELVTQQQPSGLEESLSDEVGDKLQERSQKIEHLLTITGIGFAALMALSLLSGLLYLLIGGNIPLVPGVIILILMLGGIIAGSLFIYSERLKKTLSGRSSLGSSAVPPRGTISTSADEAYPLPLSSITERTTTLLDIDTAKRDEDR